MSGLLAHPEQVNRAEVPCQRKDGSLVDVSLVAFAIRDRGGKVLGMAAVHRDITERKGAERQQALLAAIVESSDDAIITKAPDYTIQTWNGGAERLYGYGAAEIIGQPIMTLIPTDRHDELEQVVGRVLKGEKIQQYETRRRHKDGRLIEVSLSEAPVRDASGRITGVAAIERDISERLRTRRLESQMASIVKSTAYAIYSAGPGHVVQTWNHGAERLFGYRAEEVIGRPSATMIPECQAQLDEMLGRVLDGGETVEFESQRRRKDGVTLDVSVTASPIYDNSGMVGGIAVVTRDITQRKLAERALVQTQRELRAPECASRRRWRGWVSAHWANSNPMSLWPKRRGLPLKRWASIAARLWSFYPTARRCCCAPGRAGRRDLAATRQSSWGRIRRPLTFWVAGSR